jgi:superfamily II DNA or RNA helicase
MKYTIEKQGMKGVIIPVPTGKLSTMLNKQMHYVKQGIEYMTNPIWGHIYLYNRKKGTFPWGFYAKVCTIFKKWKEYSGDEYELPKQFTKCTDLFYDEQLRPYQKTAVKSFCMLGGGIICIPTGGGKTRVALEVIKQLQKKTLVIVHTRDLLSQWEKVADENTIVKTYQSIKSYYFLRNFGLVIFDEAHHVSAKMLYRIAMQCDDAILMGLSATPYRTDGEDMRIEAVLGKKVYEITRKELIDCNYLSHAKVYYHDLEQDVFNYWMGYQDAYKGYIVENEYRNKKIVEIIKDEYKKKKKILVLFNIIEHMEKIQEQLKDEDVIFINGQLAKKKREELVEEIHKRDSCIILASTIFDEGVDFPNMDVLVLAGGGKSSIKVTQRVGRILRKADNKTHAIIHDFVDRCKWLYGHYKSRRKILEEDFEVIDNEKNELDR